jgi:hypothetical protein
MIYGTPTIVTNGLVLNLDAASPKAAPTRNLLYTTNDLTNTGAWFTYNSTVTASATTAPDSTNTAYAWNISTSGTGSVVRIVAVNTNSPISSSVYGGQYTFSVYVKNRNCTAKDFNLSIYNGPYNIGFEPIFSITSSFAPQTASFGNTTFSNPILRSEDAGDGWYRISYTTTVTASLNTFNVFFDIEAGGGTKVAGEGIYIWGPQFEAAPAPTPYQPVISTNRPWPSLIGSITGSMINRPTFSSRNGGGIVLDGVNDYVSLSNSTTTQFSNTDPWSFSIITELLSQNAEYPSILNKGSAATTGLLLYYFSSGSIVLKHNNLQPNPIIVPMNMPFVYTTTYSGSGAVKIYLNGIYRVDGPTIVSVDTTNNLTLGFGDAYSNIRVYNFSKYNRSLTQQEITQNYNALKSRYGLS